MRAVDEHPLLEGQIILSGALLSEKYGSVLNEIKKEKIKVAGEIYNLKEVSGFLIGTSSLNPEDFYSIYKQF